MHFFNWNPFLYIRKDTENDEMQILFSMDLVSTSRVRDLIAVAPISRQRPVR